MKDELKGVAVGAVFGLLAMEFLYAAIRRWPEHWWVVCAAAFMAFFILMADLAPVLHHAALFQDSQTARKCRLDGSFAGAFAAPPHTRVKGVFEWKIEQREQEGQRCPDGAGQHAPDYPFRHAPREWFQYTDEDARQ